MNQHNATDDLDFVEGLIALLDGAPKKPIGMEESQAWYADACEYWKDVSQHLSRCSQQLERLSNEFLKDKDFPPTRAYTWQLAKKSFEPEEILANEVRTMRDIPYILGLTRRLIPGQRSRLVVRGLLEKLLAPLRAKVESLGEGQPLVQ